MTHFWKLWFRCDFRRSSPENELATTNFIASLFQGMLWTTITWSWRFPKSILRPEKELTPAWIFLPIRSIRFTADTFSPKMTSKNSKPSKIKKRKKIIGRQQHLSMLPPGSTGLFIKMMIVSMQNACFLKHYEFESLILPTHFHIKKLCLSQNSPMDHFGFVKFVLFSSFVLIFLNVKISDTGFQCANWRSTFPASSSRWRNSEEPSATKSIIHSDQLPSTQTLILQGS